MTHPASVAVDSTATPAPGAATPKTSGTLGPETMDRSVPVVASPRPAPSAATVTPRDQLLIRVRSAFEGVQVQSAVLTPVRGSGDTVITALFETAFDGSALTTAGATAVRGLGAALRRLDGYQLTVRPVADVPAQRDARVRAVVDGLVSGGIERGRIRQGRSSSSGTQAREVVEIRVAVP
jgi:hypothetical protein